MPGKFEAPRNGGNPPRRSAKGSNPPSRSGNGGGSPNRSRPPKGRGCVWLLLLLPLALAVVVAVLLLSRCGRQADGASDNQTRPPKQTAAPTETTVPMPTVISTATVVSQGDLLMHKYLFTADSRFPAACNLGDGTYNFDSVFRYMDPYVADADYAVVNLETTFGGDEFPYQGNPSFNCPDALADSLSDAGYDMLLTANNHSYDTLMAGVNRTLEQARDRGLKTLGTRLSEEEDRYSIVEVNGIRIGMVCYTFTLSMSGGKPSLNNNSPVEKPEQINYFSADNLDGFYSEMDQIVQQMNAQGAEATMLFIHWGTEYELTQSDTQRAIAQKMCDLGIDVIVGGHPHVVQPIELLTSTQDSQHKTVCIYSLGNAVSNQRREEMRMKTGHTEDGALFSVTFEKYDDGSVCVAQCDVLPTWVYKFVNKDGKVEYNILPLDKSDEARWKDQFGLTDAQNQELQASYTRTMDIVGSGLTQCQTYLREQREQGSGAADASAA